MASSSYKDDNSPMPSLTDQEDDYEDNDHEDDDYEDDYCDYDDDDENMEDLSAPRYEYKVLTKSEILQNQNQDIASVSAIYSLSRPDATALLLRFNWSLNRLHDSMLEDEQAARKSAGLLDPPKPKSPSRSCDRDREVLCKICLEDRKISSLHYSGNCGHGYCSECWTGYVGSKISEGPSCLGLRCPEPACPAAVTEPTILKFSPNSETREKYSKFLIRSYVEDRGDTKWCPAPGCESAVRFTPGSGGFDVTCLCGSQFCWNCLEEAHQPVDCATVRTWIIKNSSESENVTYILAYTKPCPKCKRPIEKNDGCNHMTCNSACKHQFCWICLLDWKGHQNCNSFSSNDTKTDEEKLKERAKQSLQRYTHYYERWANNNKSRSKAKADLEEIRAKHMDKIKNFQIAGDSNKESYASFINEAWEQIIECRRVLKWTYAYGYYIPNEEEAKKGFFEYVQGEAERGLERLHAYAEKEFKPFLELTALSPSFDGFRTELVVLTQVTKGYFVKLVKALQDGLADVESGSSL